jgi:LysR family glycine cleavage system transcriptional activator
VAISSPLFFEQDITAGRLLQPFELVVRDQRDYWLTYPAALRSSEKIRAFRAWLLAQAAAYCEERPGAG